MDIAFAFETSRGSQASFDDMKNLAANLLDHFKLGATESHVSLCTFSDTTTVTTKFLDEYDNDRMKQRIRSLRFDSGDKCSIGKFLREAKKNIFSLSGQSRQSQPRNLVIFTNCRYTQSQLAEARVTANSLQESADVMITVVNAADVRDVTSQSVLQEIATDKAHLINADAERLTTTSLQKQVAETVCASK